MCVSLYFLKKTATEENQHKSMEYKNFSSDEVLHEVVDILFEEQVQKQQQRQRQRNQGGKTESCNEITKLENQLLEMQKKYLKALNEIQMLKDELQNYKQKNNNNK